MTEEQRKKLRAIKKFDQLIDYLRDELRWPIEEGYDEDDLTFDWSDDLGLKESERVGISEIKQLRPLQSAQPWGIFFINFEKKALPIVILRRVLNALVLKKRASANKGQQAAWQQNDLLFISAFGANNARQLTFAHFSKSGDPSDSAKATLRVLGWDDEDTNLKLDYVTETLNAKLTWPKDTADVAAWHSQWSGAFELRHNQVINTAQELAQRLAALATRIRNRMRQVLPLESEKGELRTLMAGFKAALLNDLTEEKFADMYAQTITYGLFSAAVSRTVPGAGTSVEQGNVVDMVPVTNPFLKEMLQSFLKAGGQKNKLDFDELGIQEVVDVLNDKQTNLEAVLRDFGNKNQGEDPVIHFYEQFLAAYDKQLKIQRGVFYTPQPVVSYIVRSVHELLQTEFGLEDGLASTVTWAQMLKTHKHLKLPPLTDAPGEKRTISADEPFVQILDPATGTATFPVEVISLIHKTMMAKWAKQGLKKDAQLIEWNTYVPKHLLPRLHAYELMMAPYAIAHMKVGLKLAETGYKFASDERARIYLTNALEPWKQQLELPEFAALAHEAQAVNEIKRSKRFTVVIGNPPYSGESANKIENIETDIRNYYQTINGVPLIERGKKNWLLDDYVKFTRLAHTIIYKTNYGIVSYIVNNAFQDNPTFRGMRHKMISDFSEISIVDLRGSSKRVNAGGMDENVFDIMQGVCIVTLLRKQPNQRVGVVRRAEVSGVRDYKYRMLSMRNASFPLEIVIPTGDQWYFIPIDKSNEEEWLKYISVPDAMPLYGNGMISSKDHFAYAYLDVDLQNSLDVFVSKGKSDKWVSENLKIKDNSMWALHDARIRFRKERRTAEKCEVAYRPFDIRHSMFHRDIIFNLRAPVNKHIVNQDNVVLQLSRMTKGADWHHCFVSNKVSDCALLSNKTSTNSFSFPLWVNDEEDGLFSSEFGRHENYTLEFRRKINAGISEKGGDTITSENALNYMYAALHSPSYRSRYSEFLKLEFPRIPFPGSRTLFQRLAKLGEKLISLHLMKSSILNRRISKFTGGNKTVSKVGYSDGTVWIDAGGSKGAVVAGSSGFSGVPEDVWNFYVGGYQVCEKWLKDRKDRTLSGDDITHYNKIVVALKETIALMAEIDDVIEAHGGWPGAFADSTNLSAKP